MSSWSISGTPARNKPPVLSSSQVDRLPSSAALHKPSSSAPYRHVTATLRRPVSAAALEGAALDQAISSAPPNLAQHHHSEMERARRELREERQRAAHLGRAQDKLRAQLQSTSAERTRLSREADQLRRERDGAKKALAGAGAETRELSEEADRTRRCVPPRCCYDPAALC